MRPLPPAPFLPDSTEAIRKADEEGLRLAAELIQKDEEARYKFEIKREREQTPEGLFVEPGHEPEPSTRAALTTLSSGPYAGLQSAKKRKRENIDPEEGSKVSFGPAKKAAKKGAALKNVQTINSRTMDQGPEWYDTIDSKQHYSRGDMQDLKYLFTLVNDAKKDAADGKDLTRILSKIRQRIQQMEFYTCLSPILVKKSGLLDNGGLSLVFENRVQNVDFPYEIRADADILFRKWMSGQIDPHLFRGIVTKKGTGKEERGFKSHSIQKDFPGKVTCNYIGAGNLVNGQWWPLQMCAKRDGAHGEVEAGIHGQKDKGAYSVVISGGGYANVDEGNSVKYCGTQGTGNSPSAGTNLMLKAYESQQSLRVLRSASLPANNTYRPARGLRYDGLYRIISHEILDQKTAMYRFSLSRLEGQDPIRFSDDDMIPSNAQILELNKIRDQIG